MFRRKVRNTRPDVHLSSLSRRMSRAARILETAMRSFSTNAAREPNWAARTAALKPAQSPPTTNWSHASFKTVPYP
jgi:hypothetical protein